MKKDLEIEEHVRYMVLNAHRVHFSAAEDMYYVLTEDIDGVDITLSRNCFYEWLVMSHEYNEKLLRSSTRKRASLGRDLWCRKLKMKKQVYRAYIHMLESCNLIDPTSGYFNKRLRYPPIKCLHIVDEMFPPVSM